MTDPKDPEIDRSIRLVEYAAQGARLRLKFLLDYWTATTLTGELVVATFNDVENLYNEFKKTSPYDALHTDVVQANKAMREQEHALSLLKDISKGRPFPSIHQGIEHLVNLFQSSKRSAHVVRLIYRNSLVVLRSDTGFGVRCWCTSPILTNAVIDIFEQNGAEARYVKDDDRFAVIVIPF